MGGGGCIPPRKDYHREGVAEKVAGGRAALPAYIIRVLFPLSGLIISFSISIISSCQIEQPFGAAIFMPKGGSGKEGAWLVNSDFENFMKKIKNWTKYRVISKNFVV